MHIGTHRIIQLLARLCSVHLAREGDRGHSGVQSVDDAIVHGAHKLQHLLKNITKELKEATTESNRSTNPTPEKLGSFANH